MLWLLIIAAVAIVGYFIATYNSFQTIKTRIEASIQEIGNQLKRQASLIPNLSESVKSYLKHEKDIFKKLTDARKAVQEASKDAGSVDKVDQAIKQINSILPSLNVLVESNPELKADGVVTKLMDELRDTSDKIMYARRTLIDLSADYNRKLITFPSNLVAKVFGFTKMKGLETPMSGEHVSVSASETKDVKIDLD